MNNVISIIENSKAVYMASVDGEGRPEIRALLNLCNPQKYNDLAGRALVVDGTDRPNCQRKLLAGGVGYVLSAWKNRSGLYYYSYFIDEDRRMVWI